MTTPLPRGIDRDDTEHGKLYYTRSQMLAYGLAYAADEMSKVDASRMKNNASGQPGKGAGSSAAIADLMNKFGMKS